MPTIESAAPRIGIGIWENSTFTTLDWIESQSALGWYYNWRPDQIWDVSSQPRSVEFVPMIHNERDIGKAIQSETPITAILGFNEPDGNGSHQAGMSVERAIALWPRLEAHGVRLGSPAATQDQTLGAESWLGRFMAEAERQGLRVDFIAVHYYSSDGDIEAFRQFLVDVHEAYGRPVWVTEYAFIDWSHPGRVTYAQNAEFMRLAVQMLESLDFVERHAWFAANPYQWGSVTPQINLMDDSLQPTPVGETFADLTSGAPGDMVLQGDEADNLLIGQGGNDSLFGHGGADELQGGDGADLLDGGAGDDVLVGGAGNDTLIGGSGDDRIAGGAGGEYLDGSEGAGDTLDYSTANGAMTLRLWGNFISGDPLAENDTIAGFENVETGSGNDLLCGDSGGNALSGNGGMDTLQGFDGNDTLSGGAGRDILRGGAGQDVLSGGLGRDTLSGAEGEDVFLFGSAAEAGLGADRDIIVDFEQGVDVIDITGLSADVFEFRGSRGFDGSGNPELRMYETKAGSTIVRMDSDGDGFIDSEIRVVGVTGLTADDFLL